MGLTVDTARPEDQTATIDPKSEARIRRRYKLAPGTPPLIALRGITKIFPGVIANKDVNLQVYPGEIHALLGENGAGKSTLMNVLTGIYRPDVGEVLVDGYACDLSSPQSAIAVGIGMVHQHFKLVQAFSVAENIHLGWRDTPLRTSRQRLDNRTRALAEKFNLNINPSALVADLSTGEQQRVEILRVLARDARLLILDEPTAVLTPAEADNLFAALRLFVARGNAVIFISHKLDEVLANADRISVLRRGRNVATVWTSDCDEAELAEMMVGHELRRNSWRQGECSTVSGMEPVKKPVLELCEVQLMDAPQRVSLTLHAGEILGIAGVAGSGQRELCQLIAGLIRPRSGKILLEGRDLAKYDPRQIMELGLGHIPEDRLGSGLAPSLSVTDNAVLRNYLHAPVARGLWMRKRGALDLAKQLVDRANISIPDFDMPVRNLSGGNQQRLVTRREISIARKVLIAAYPSRGLDLGAVETVMGYLSDLRAQGVAILFISEDLDELVSISDRIAVLSEGRVMGVPEVAHADLKQIGLMMGGRSQELH
jgi:ABC-type uncharacterized transport system ATPase subunit